MYASARATSRTLRLARSPPYAGGPEDHDRSSRHLARSPAPHISWGTSPRLGIGGDIAISIDVTCDHRRATRHALEQHDSERLAAQGRSTEHLGLPEKPPLHLLAHATVPAETIRIGVLRRRRALSGPSPTTSSTGRPCPLGCRSIRSNAGVAPQAPSAPRDGRGTAHEAAVIDEVGGRGGNETPLKSTSYSPPRCPRTRSRHPATRPQRYRRDARDDAGPERDTGSSMTALPRERCRRSVGSAG